MSQLINNVKTQTMKSLQKIRDQKKRVHKRIGRTKWKQKLPNIEDLGKPKMKRELIDETKDTKQILLSYEKTFLFFLFLFLLLSLFFFCIIIIIICLFTPHWIIGPQPTQASPPTCCQLMQLFPCPSPYHLQLSLNLFSWCFWVSLYFLCLMGFLSKNFLITLLTVFSICTPSSVILYSSPVDSPEYVQFSP